MARGRGACDFDEADMIEGLRREHHVVRIPPAIARLGAPLWVFEETATFRIVGGVRDVMPGLDHHEHHRRLPVDAEVDGARRHLRPELNATRVHLAGHGHHLLGGAGSRLGVRSVLVVLTTWSPHNSMSTRYLLGIRLRRLPRSPPPAALASQPPMSVACSSRVHTARHEMAGRRQCRRTTSTCRRRRGRSRRRGSGSSRRTQLRRLPAPTLRRPSRTCAGRSGHHRRRVHAETTVAQGSHVLGVRLPTQRDALVEADARDVLDVAEHLRDLVDLVPSHGRQAERAVPDQH